MVFGNSGVVKQRVSQYWASSLTEWRYSNACGPRKNHLADCFCVSGSVLDIMSYNGWVAVFWMYVVFC